MAQIETKIIFCSCRVQGRCMWRKGLCSTGSFRDWSWWWICHQHVASMEPWPVAFIQKKRKSMRHMDAWEVLVSGLETIHIQLAPSDVNDWQAKLLWACSEAAYPMVVHGSAKSSLLGDVKKRKTKGWSRYTIQGMPPMTRRLQTQIYLLKVLSPTNSAKLWLKNEHYLHEANSTVNLIRYRLTAIYRSLYIWPARRANRTKGRIKPNKGGCASRWSSFKISEISATGHLRCKLAGLTYVSLPQFPSPHLNPQNKDSSHTKQGILCSCKNNTSLLPLSLPASSHCFVHHST